MSWSVAALGKPKAVAEKLKQQFADITYLTGAEAKLKELAAEAVAVALADYSDSTAVRVNCSGSAYSGEKSAQDFHMVINRVEDFTE